jgi:hypothetical protein
LTAEKRVNLVFKNNVNIHGTNISFEALCVRDPLLQYRFLQHGKQNKKIDDFVDKLIICIFFLWILR